MNINTLLLNIDYYVKNKRQKHINCPLKIIKGLVVNKINLT